MNTPKITFVFPKLSFLSILITLFFKTLRNSEMYYVEIGSRFNKLSTINKLEKYGFKWIKKEYDHYSEYSQDYFTTVKYADELYEKTKHSYSYREICNYLGINDDLKKKMKVLWKWRFCNFVKDFASQTVAAKYLLEKENKRRIILITDNLIACLLKNVLDERIKYIFLPSIFDLSSFFNRIWKKMIATFKRKHKNTNNSFTVSFKEKIRVEDFEVIFFPHHGIFYGELFKKDHFYNEDINSPFHKSKILHISLGEKWEQHMSKSYTYYRENNIPFVDAGDLPYKRKRIKRDFLNLLKKIHIRLFNDIYKFGIGYLLVSILVFYFVRKYYLIFCKFKKLKMALVGFDMVFPLDLSFALSLLGVRVCASQERFIQAFYPHAFYIFDYYFVSGKFVIERGFKSSQIKNYIPVGFVRADRLFEYENNKVPDEKYDIIKLKKKLILALDYFVPANAIENIEIDPSCRIENIRKFYNDLIKLALEIPSIYVVIKGKNRISYESVFIKDLVEKIKSIDNMCIELNLGKYNPYYIAEKADLTIACHTSLADELLVANRKVIFYETADYMETFFNYDNLPIIVKDYEALKYHVQNFLNGIYLNADTINKLKEFYSNCYHGNVRKKIQSTLEQIIENKKLHT